MRSAFLVVRRFFVFFLLVAFVVTCNVVLFIKQITFTEDEIRMAAPIVFFNVIFLSTLFYAIDAIRRYLTVTKPVQRIHEGLEQVVAGDFSVRIPYFVGENGKNEFDIIIRELNHMTAELAGVETLRTDFISNVSHEIKTPLAVIQNYSTILQSDMLTPEERKRYATAITEQTKKLTDLITNILKLNRLENQQIYPEKKEYNLTEQLCECLLGFEYAWEKKNLEIETELEEDVYVCEDAELLSLVWNNLFSNAVKFSEEGGKIGLSLKKENGRAIVSVSDTGCGISPEVGARIFDKFYQGDTSHATQGNGLGLALVKRVIDITGGEIGVSSVPGKGTTFTVRLTAVTER